MDSGKSNFHALLLRQLKRFDLDTDDISPEKREDWRQFLGRVSQAYSDADQERYLLDRSIDISTKELMDANQKLQVEKTTLKTIFEGTPDAMIIVHKDGTIYMANNQAIKLFKFTNGDMIGKSINVLIPQRYHHSHDASCRSFFDTKETRAMGAGRELKAADKYGTEFPVEIGLSPITTHEGALVLASVRDISERKAAEEELAKVNEKLLDVSRQAGMAEVASAVLHNIGNIMNSINVSIDTILEMLPTLSIHRICPISEIIKEHISKQDDYLIHDDKGKLLPSYLTELAKSAEEECDSVFREISVIAEQFMHIKEVITSQVNIACASGVKEKITVETAVEQAIKLALTGHDLEDINVTVDIEINDYLIIEKHKLLQILINLIKNAKDSLIASKKNNKEIIIRSRVSAENSFVSIRVTDNGLGIDSSNLEKIFAMGFTTKVHGHGFGVHSSALHAKELGGRLRVESEGLGKGATFIFEIPKEGGG